jgi:hypothetical protein
MRAAFFLRMMLALALETLGQDLKASASETPLAVVTIHVAKHSFKVGENIEVTLFLEPGPNGVYVSKEWGQAGGLITGFYANLETVGGRDTQTCGFAVDGWKPPDPDATNSLERNFIFLRPGQLIAWRTILGCLTHRRGKYRIRASYNPREIDTERVAELPDTKGLVLRQPVEAKRVEVSIY